MILLSRILFILSLSFALSGLGGAAYAGRDHETRPQTETSAWHSNDYSRVRLIRGGQNEDGQDLVGLVIEMDEGWHTYWRSPGILGLPPTFNWEGSTNIQGVTVRWPLPQHISFDEYETYGYEDRLVLPLEVSRINPDEPASLQLALGYAVCESICIPVLGFLAMNLPSGERAARARPEFVWAIEDALAHVPTRDLTAAGIDIAPALFVRSPAAQRVLRISISSATRFEDPHVIMEGPKGLRFGRPKLMLDSTGRHLEALVSVTRRSNDHLAFGQGLEITVIGGAMPVQHGLTIVMSGTVDWHEPEMPDAPEPAADDHHDGTRPDGEGPPR